MILSAALVETGDTGLTATRDGDALLVSGSLAMVSSAHLAARVLVPVRTDGDALDLLLLDPTAQGSRVESAVVVNQSLQSTLSLDGVRVSDTDRLGAPGRGAEILAWIRERAELAQCAVQVGVAGRALEMVVEYTSERRPFDQPVGTQRTRWP